jgi:hypothetical protein
MIMNQLSPLAGRADAASRLRAWVAAALADDSGQTLKQAMQQS